MHKINIFALIAVMLFLLTGCGDDSNPVVPPPPPPPPPSPPVINSVQPARASLGEITAGLIKGANFTGATNVNMGQGVVIQNFTVKNATEIEVQFRVNLTANPEQKTVSVTTPAGTGSSSKDFEVINNLIPKARIDVTPDRGAVNTAWTFSALNSDDPDGTILTYNWNFGDNKRASGSLVHHRFANPGNYEVRLTVIDNDDAIATTTLALRVEKGAAPAAKFIISPKEGDINTVFTFDGSISTDGDGRIRDYLWNFGNGRTATGPVVQQQFSSAQPFTIQLTVTDNRGLQDTDARDLIVGAFDEENAKRDIEGVILQFFRLYSQLTELSAEEIVVGWSTSGTCRGREHEINIINKQQQTILENEANVSGTIEIFFSSSTRATAIAPGHFEWTDAEGDHEGDATHDFQMIFENGEWLICNFTVTAGTPELVQMMQ